ncbi:hypothetical protein BABINDRAFT_159945 [Babjeviella inositovora NRRL Y-12698]|uniref:Skg3/CAF120-like PH-like domain-containing protein n=1 Tax=Babjeviella inositovora NRRL Y-12698 TaxID=984486 RepID=A0A1E3QVK1_9ASCO|nr:uncharacterized protein BABINDRAFT_159945 [Babjeviella inositovora NRRL Y-12698]ODQ81688.1 hypothetical protein BABINDRAFT_159945 [Babjeviella inositovora NRRL Y-12698]
MAFSKFFSRSRSGTPPPPSADTYKPQLSSPLRESTNRNDDPFESPYETLVSQSPTPQLSVPRSRRESRLPSPVIRQSLVFASPDDDDMGTWELPSDVPEQLIPIVTLMNAQQIRVYREGKFQIPVGKFSSPNPAGSFNAASWTDVRGQLCGNELTIWPLSQNLSDDSVYINIIDAHVQAIPNELKIVVSTDLFASYSMKFSTAKRFESWLAAFKLSQFEYISLNEAFTATVVAWKGLGLSDISYLLNSKHGARDWVDIRLPHLLSKWVKCYMVISDSPNKKKSGRVELYASDKISKKNLVAHVENAFAIFNVYPQTHKVVDENGMLKLHGGIKVNEKYLDLFAHSSDDSRKRRSLSVRRSSDVQPPAFHFAHSRTVSTSSAVSVSSDGSSSPALNGKKKEAKHKYQTFQSLYIMPKRHGSVKNVETMIRTYLPLISSFKLYGKPDQLLSSKKEPDSLLFAMPHLPKSQYLSFRDAEQVINSGLGGLFSSNAGEIMYWRNAFKATLLAMINSPEGFHGCGHLSEIYSSDEMDNVHASRSSSSIVGGIPKSKRHSKISGRYGLSQPVADDFVRQVDELIIDKQQGKTRPGATIAMGNGFYSGSSPSTRGEVYQRQSPPLSPRGQSFYNADDSSWQSKRDRVPHPFAQEPYRGVETELGKSSSSSLPSTISSGVVPPLSELPNKVFQRRRNDSSNLGLSQEKSSLVIV